MQTDTYVNVVKCMCVDPCIHSHTKLPKKMISNCLVPLHPTFLSQKITGIGINTYGSCSVFRSLLSACHPMTG